MRLTLYLAIAVMTALSIFISQGALAQDENPDNAKTYYKKPYSKPVISLPEGWNVMPTGPKQNHPDNTMSPTISADAKMAMFQTMMMFSPWGLRDMIAMMVAKKKVAEGISFDEVMESMDVRANSLNMKKVGHNTPYKVMEQITGKKTPRLEIVSYCDVPVMFAIVNFVPEFSAFVPCRITVLEDAKGDIWITSLDWDVRWLDTAPSPNKISDELRQDAIKVREAIESIMDAGANGDL